VDYLGFDIPDAWVVGYGLDYADRYRTLPYIGVLEWGRGAVVVTERHAVP
jgi:hypoxanthine-guanine phosphoribosyltransferase